MRRRQGQGIAPSTPANLEEEPCFSGRTSNFDVLTWDSGRRSGVADANIGARHHRPSLNPGMDTRKGSKSMSVPVFELSEACCCRKGPSAGELLVRRPVAMLALVPKPLVLFTAGAVAGAIGEFLLPSSHAMRNCLLSMEGIEMFLKN